MDFEDMQCGIGEATGGQPVQAGPETAADKTYAASAEPAAQVAAGQTDPTLVKPAEPTLVQQQPAMAAGSTIARPQPVPAAGTARQSSPGYVPPTFGAQTNVQQAPSYQRPYAAPKPTVETAAVRTKNTGRGTSFLWGLFGGMLGAAAVAGGLYLGGVLTPRVSSQTVPAPATHSGQSFSITASDTDVSTAKAVAAKALPSVVSVNCTLAGGASTGSGVIFDAQGNIITNNHVIDGAESIEVIIEGETYAAEVVGTDASSDIAVIKADLGGAAVTPMEMGDSSALVPGDWVMTVGSPFGLDSSVSSGIVSSLYRSELMYGTNGNTLYANLIQVDAAINPGNSGGALVNDRGQLVGICTLFSSDTQSFAGIGFAIPGNYAAEVAQKIISGEQVTHAYIGLSMMTVTSQNAKANKLSVDYGAYVAEVIEDGPAEAAGLQVGDVVISIAGEKISSADAAVLAIRSHSIGETVPVTVMRGDERLTFDVTLGSDEKLQELQRQQMEQQQMEQEQQEDFWNREDGTGEDYSLEDLYNEWLDELFGDQEGQDGAQGWEKVFAPDDVPQR